MAATYGKIKHGTAAGYDYHGCRCQECRALKSLKNRKYWPNRADGQKIKQRKRTKTTAEQNKEFVNAAKAHPCKDCKNTFPPCVMQFDHLDPSTKYRSISHMLRYSREVIKAEIAKCELVCANCHAIRTFITRPALLRAKANLT